MRSKRLFALGLALWILFAGSAFASEVFGGVRVVMEERAEGGSNVLIPTLTGHPDADLEREINRRIAERLRVEELLRILDRAQVWADESGASGIRMEAGVQIIGSLLSLVVSIRGELPGGDVGQMYASYNCDLATGREVMLADLFAPPAQDAVARMESIARDRAEREGLNAYQEFAEVSPLPAGDFSLDARGLTVYYPRNQYRLVNGDSGAFLFPYYQIEDDMERSPVTDALLAQRPAPADPAGQVREDIAAGELPGIPARLGEPMAGYIERYGLWDAPDYTLDGPLYQFVSPQMQGVKLSAAMYPEDPEDTSEAVISIRATLVDLYGLRPRQSTLLDAIDLLGPPDEATELDEEAAYDMLLTVGKSFWYGAQGNRLELHADESGVLSAVILHAGD